MIRQFLCISSVFILVFPALTFADTKILITGLSTIFDYDDPQYESALADSTTGNPSEKTDKRNEESATLGLRPVVKFLSESKDGNFQFRTAPGIKYDLIDSEFDWDVDVHLAATQSLHKNWKLSATNILLRRDEYDPQSSAGTDSGAQAVEGESNSPELAVDRGRSRYWLNTLNFVSDHPYGEDSQFGLGFGHRILRNDESAVRSYEDYDRFEFITKNSHRFTSAWKAGADLGVVRGDFENTEMAPSEEDNGTTEAAPVEDEPSDDLREFRGKALVENNAFRHHDISLDYTYIGLRYDEAAQDDVDIHEGQLVWRHDFSRHVQTRLGAGPSYGKTEGQEAQWSGNGIADLKYLFRPGSLTFTGEKGYDVDNFSGTGERGFVDFWNVASRLEYRLLEDLSFNCHVAYRYEDRRNSSAIDETEAVAAEEEVEVTEEGYNKDRYTAGTGLRYTFLKYYTTSLNYTYIKQDSEREGDDYEDHRLVLVLSWEKEWLRW